ncbi:MAG TPA: response regulator transcription factor, partial [Acidimicrobiales bacterium]|nr:response regulator transcription factor [Acidimicrobiales bacterium]
GDGAAAVELTRRLAPDVVLMDIRMPGVDGLDATRMLTDPAARCAARVLVLTTFELDEYVFGALRAGASGFLLKHQRGDDLVEAVRTAAAGDALLAPSVTKRLIEAFQQSAVSGPIDQRRLDVLTSRERDTLELIGRGLNNIEIARQFHVGEATVKTHVGHIFSKLAVRDRIQAVIVAYETGLVRPGRP